MKYCTASMEKLRYDTVVRYHIVEVVGVFGLFWGNLSKLKLTAYFDEIAQKIRPPAAGGDSPRPPD